MTMIFFAYFAFLYPIFCEEGKCDLFSYGQLVFLWSIFEGGGGEGILEGEITP